MQTIPQLTPSSRRKSVLTIALSVALAIPTTLGALPAHATGAVPGPIGQVVQGQRGANSVALSWTQPWAEGDSPVTDYLVELRHVGGAWVTFNDGISTTTSAEVSGLDAGSRYNIRVSAVNAHGVGPATVLGAFDGLMSNNNELCGSTNDSPLTCVTAATAIKTVGYYKYPDTAAATIKRVSDITDVEGLCSLSKTAGVICSSMWKNRYGELGQGLVGGPIASFAVPIPTDEDILSIESNTSRNCALDAARQLWCWGNWHTTTRASANLLSPTVVKNGVVQFEGSCARMWDGTVECLDADDQWTSIPGLPPIVQLEYSSGIGWSTCALGTSRTVICFNTVTKAWSVRTEWQGAISISADKFGARCVLLETGSVKCAGPNLKGELGDGTRSTSGASTVKLPEPVIALAANKRLSSATLTSYTCAVGVSSALYCWGEYARAFSTGLKLSTVPLPVSGGAPAEVTPLAAPGPVGAIEQVSRGTNTVGVMWATAPSPEAAITGHLIRWSHDSGVNWSTAPIGTANTWESPQVPANSIVWVQIAAVSSAGTGLWSPTFAATTTMPPDAPADLVLSTVSGRNVTVRWNQSFDGEEPIIRFDLQYTLDGTNWSTLIIPGEARSTTLNNIAARSALDIRVRAVSAAGISEWSDSVSLTIAGTASQFIFVTNSAGEPVVGGQVTWAMSSGNMRSALDYGLTDVGIVNFPIAPAGKAVVTLRNVLMPSGATATGTRTVVFGAQRNPFIVLPREPSAVSHKVTVLLPNGQPVMGAKVLAEGLEGGATLGDINFVTPEPLNAATTNEFGEAQLIGYSTIDTTLHVEFNDGVLVQTLQGKLGLGDQIVTLEEMPWVDPLIDSTTVNSGTLVSIPVATSSPGTLVNAVVPSGAPQLCAGRVLSARSDSLGRATLKVCATAAGSYRVTSIGAVSTSAVTINLNGTRSSAVRQAKAVSPGHLSARVTWNAPAFTGGNPITSYTVAITNSRGVTVSRVVTTRTVTFTGLTGAMTHSVRITPNTRLGAGAPVVLTVPVS